jgi:hypothetical protein
MATELAKRVIVTGLMVTLPLALAAVVFFGLGAGAGVVGGALVALLNFGGLAREAVRATDSGRRRLRLGLRQLAVFATLGGLLVSDWTHPVAVAAGLMVLPPVLVAQGLHAARD